MLALALMAAPLSACGCSAAQNGGADSAAAQKAQTAGIDVSSWKTLGDALAHDSGTNSSAGWNGERYVTVFSAGDSVVRVVAKLDPQSYEKLEALDMTQADYEQKFMEVMGGLELESAEDLTEQKLSKEELDAYVGKTAQDLANDGFTFESYWMYGGNETGVTMAKGPLAYNVTFNVTISDSQTEDNGASVMGSTVVAMEYAGASMNATDPSMV